MAHTSINVKILTVYNSV